MKIVLLTQYFPPEIGAPQTRLAAMVSALIEAGDTVEVVTAMPNYPLGRIFPEFRGRLLSSRTENGVLVRRVWMFAAMGSGWKRVLSYFSFTAFCCPVFIRVRRPDVLVVESPPLSLAVPAILFGKIRRVPVVVNVADMWPDAAVAVGALKAGRFLRLMLRLEAWAYRQAMVVSTVTDGVRGKLIAEKGVPQSKIAMLANGVDTDLFDPSSGDSEILRHLDLPEAPFVVYAGTMGLVHGLDQLIDAFATMVGSNNPYLLMIGSGSERARLAERCEREGLTNVLFRDPIPLTELAKLLPLAVAGVVTSAEIPINEFSRPAKLFPLMSAGLPVLFAGGGEGAQVVRTAEAGIVVRNDPEDIAHALGQLVEDPSRAHQMGLNGRQAVVESWSWGRQVQRWRAAVATIVNERN